MTELKITADAMILRGAANGPAPIVERRLDGRLLVAVPSKRNVWLVLDGAFVPVPLAKRIPSHSKAVEERIVVPVEHRDDVVALVEAWVVGGGKEQDAKRAASAAKAAATRKAKAEAKAAAEREVARVEAQAKAAEEAAARRAAAEAARPALIEACEAIASGAVSYSTYPGYDGSFVVRTPYDPRVVDVLRTIPGARWDEARRVWNVPAGSYAALAPRVVSINAWAEQTRAAEAEAARVAGEERRAKRRALDARRYLILADSTPWIGETLREGGRVVTVESLGKTFRSSDDDGMLDPWMEGELVRYVYHRAATAEEIAALVAREAKAAADAEVRCAAREILAMPGEAVQLGHEPEGEVILEDAEHAISGMRDWVVLTDDGSLWRCSYRGGDGDAWGDYNLGYNTRGTRIEATPERVAAIRAEAERRGFESWKTPSRAAPAMVSQPVQQAQACAIPAAVFAARAKVAAIKAEGTTIIDDVRVRRIEAEAARRAWMDCLNHGRPAQDAQARYSEASRLVDTTLKALWDRGEKLRLAEMEERRAAMVPQVSQQAQARDLRAGPPEEDTRHEVVGAILDELVQESADEKAIEAIGDLGGDTYLRPGRNGFDVYGDRDDSRPYTTIPRGLSPETARLLVDFWHRGYEAGLRNGAGEIQRGIKRLLAIA